jgi:hypothetical protein
MALGAALINLSRESSKLFDVLGKTDPPIYAMFFVLAGAHLETSSLWVIGVSGLGYTLARVLGKVAGGYFGSRKLGYGAVVSRCLGLTLVPHAGVAIGLALQLRNIFPDVAETISAIILGSVLINEVAGPLITKLAITRAGETRIEHVTAFEEL